MDKIEWCLKQKNGLELVEPNEELKNAYIKKAENSLRAALALKGNREWEISTSYYTMYFSLYAILMRIGIKCEIHSCTIGVMRYLLTDHFTDEDIDLIERSQKARIDAQYYSDRNVSEIVYERITEERSSFLVKCKGIANNLKEEEINKIRENIRNRDSKRRS